MKNFKSWLIGAGLTITMTGISYGLGAQQQVDGAGSGGATIGIFLPFLLLIAIIVLIVFAIIRDVKSIKRGEKVKLAIAALILSILVCPIGIILSFVAIKKG